MSRQIPLLLFCLLPIAGLSQVRDSAATFELKLEILPSKTASLSWTNATKNQEGYFFLQRRAEGGDFTTIVAIRVDNKRNNYCFTDDEPFPGTNHYRIRLVDSTGVSCYSTSVSGDAGLESFCRFYPNPTTDHVIVKSTTAALVQIFSVNGNQILTQIVNKGIYPLNVSLLAKGVYFITFTHSETKATVRNILYIN